MDSSDEYIETVTVDVRKILQNTRVPRADIHVEHFPHSQHHGTVYRSDADRLKEGAGNEANPIYAIGSLTKLLIAVMLTIIVDRLSYSSEKDDEVYRKLRKLDRDPWKATFTELFNDFSDQKIAPLPRNPTLRHVLIHLNSLPPMNFGLLAPGGTSLMSVKEFIEVAPRLAIAAHDTLEHNYIEYSNGNYILIGLLINAIDPRYTLQELMKKHIFMPLGITRTYMNNTDLGVVRYTRPYVMSTSGILVPLDTPGYSVHDIVNPAMAAWSCTRDIAALLREFLKILAHSGSLLTHASLLVLLKPDGVFDETDPESGKQTPCGIEAVLSSSTPGSKSINRLITPTKICSTYRLGLRNKTEVDAYYMAGAVNGYASCFYLIPTRKKFVIVMTNSSGFIDASDHISRYILQDIFDLKRISSLLASPKVDIPNMSLLAAQECDKILKKWKSEDTREDKPNTIPLQLCGAYRNELTQQLIEIRPGGNRLIVNIRGAADTSADIGLCRTGDFTFRLYPLGSDTFTLDRYDHYGWRDLMFDVTVEEGSDGIRRAAAIERRSDIPVSLRKYKRI